jgi:hypothetical protein
MENLLTPEEAMARIGGYKNRTAFIRAARRSGLPRIRINARVIRYDPIALEAWKRRRALGC